MTDSRGRATPHATQVRLVDETANGPCHLMGNRVASAVDRIRLEETDRADTVGADHIGDRLTTWQCRCRQPDRCVVIEVVRLDAPPDSWPTLYLNEDLPTVHAQVRHMFAGRVPPTASHLGECGVEGVGVVRSGDA
ncbi:MAG: hypothetical protein E4H05_05735 [Acidimicrobiales bacterium]|nr:MAG: hypothetical protein E4H05_05735 [Acidimicrobiales bacterium]